VNKGAKVRRVRERRRLTQSELARRSGVGRITLVRIEAGTQQATLATLERLARALRVPMRDLL
jgi:transcriptional regulator with XRE-family HTH domain